MSTLLNTAKRFTSFNACRAIKIAGLVLGFTAASFVYASSTDYSREHWVASWSSPPMAPGSAFEPPKSFENQTIREIAHLSLGGQRVRIRVSNTFGTQSLHIGAAHVALQSDGPSIVPSTDRALKFSGLPSITIPAGAIGLSDPIDSPVSSQVVST